MATAFSDKFQALLFHPHHFCPE